MTTLFYDAASETGSYVIEIRRFLPEARQALQATFITIHPTYGLFETAVGVTRSARIAGGSGGVGSLSDVR
ncbi:MAG: hypothetical protein K8U03_19370 [Planctomycetia bacterium]|nr:hypothetical protein [Planctomycetia bacterium]